MFSYHFHMFSPTPFPPFYKNICRKWENIHKSVSYYPNQILSILLSKCHPPLIWEPSQLPNTFEAWKREATQAVRSSFVFKGINPPNLRYATFLSKIKLQMFKNQDYSCCKAWLSKKGSPIHISTQIFFTWFKTAESQPKKSLRNLYYLISPLMGIQRRSSTNVINKP